MTSKSDPGGLLGLKFCTHAYFMGHYRLGWVIFATYFYLRHRAFFGVLTLSDHKYSF